jgi:hypothetical protein
VREALTSIGITVTLRTVPVGDVARPARLLPGADLALWRTDWARYDPVQSLSSLPYLPVADRETLERIARLPSPERENAAGSLALKLDRDAIHATFGDDAIPELVSPRLGCHLKPAGLTRSRLAAVCIRGNHPEDAWVGVRSLQTGRGRLARVTSARRGGGAGADRGCVGQFWCRTQSAARSIP